MYALSRRIRAISTFIFDAGISTRRCFDPQALRMRVSISAIGSVIDIRYSPLFRRIPRSLERRAEVKVNARGMSSEEIDFLCSSFLVPHSPTSLSHSGNHPGKRQIPEAD